MNSLGATAQKQTRPHRQPQPAALLSLLALAVCLALPSPAGAESATLSFVERNHDRDLDRTTFVYDLVTGEEGTINKVVLGFGLCNRPAVVEAWPTPGGTVRGLNRPTMDRESGIHGVAWDGWFSENTHQRFAYTLTGDVPLGVVRVAMHSAGDLVRRLATGPDCMAASRQAPTQAQPVVGAEPEDGTRVAEATPGTNTVQ